MHDLVTDGKQRGRAGGITRCREERLAGLEIRLFDGRASSVDA
jgi:hypothetical protein